MYQGRISLINVKIHFLAYNKPFASYLKDIQAENYTYITIQLLCNPVDCFKAQMFIKIFFDFNFEVSVYEIKKLVGTLIFLLTVFPNCISAKYSHIRKLNDHDIDSRTEIQSDVHLTPNEPLTSRKERNKRHTISNINHNRYAIT